MCWYATLVRVSVNTDSLVCWSEIVRYTGSRFSKRLNARSTKTDSRRPPQLFLIQDKMPYPIAVQPLRFIAWKNRKLVVVRYFHIKLTEPEYLERVAELKQRYEESKEEGNQAIWEALQNLKEYQMDYNMAMMEQFKQELDEAKTIVDLNVPGTIRTAQSRYKRAKILIEVHGFQYEQASHGYTRENL